MATIANAFLDDFEDEDQLENNISIASFLDVRVETIEMDDNSDEEEKNEIISDLLDDPKLRKILEKATELLNVNSARSLSEDSADYESVQQCNDMARKIEVEIFTVHRHICDIYASRFPELEQTVSHPVKYAKVVKKIKNDIDSVSSALEGVVSDHQKLSTSISASATSGKPLPESDLKKVLEACDLVIGLDMARNRLLDFIKSRMLTMAPNLSAMIGSDIAAQLITLAGGLRALSNIPSCNVQTIGSTKRSEKSGHVLFAKDPHAGVVSKSTVILECPEELHSKALRLLCAKITLAARVDCHQDKPCADVGNLYLKQITQKIEKWQEPLEGREEKPLPLPKERRTSKRAGKRYRKMREKLKVTELQRMKNRVGFNVGENKDDEDGEGFGMIGKAGAGGAIRIVSKDTVKVRKLERINKIMVDRERKKRQRRLGRGESSGLATSVVMTEVQGMSFVNPELAQNSNRAGGQSGVSTYFGSKSFNKVKL